MTREELFRAVGEVREDQLAEAEARHRRPWRQLGVLAACLALTVTAVSAVPWVREQEQWKALIYSFNPGGETEPQPDGVDSGGSEDLDGNAYWTEKPAEPVRPDCSTGVEIGQMSGPGDGDSLGWAEASCVAWLTPEEIFAQDTEIFRGTVRELQYYLVELESTGMAVYYTRALVEVTDSIRGTLAEGETYSLLWLGAKGYLYTTLTGPLEKLESGSEAIFMPIRTGEDTGWRQGDSYFCYGDLAELYLSEGMRYVFASTGDGLDFERTVYQELAEAETLDEVAAYIRRTAEP